MGPVQSRPDSEMSDQTGVNWEGSTVTENDITWLRKTRRVPDEVSCRIPPRSEVVLNPETGERVVFISHFLCGFGLPASYFFCSFLDRFGLQPHHLPANAILFLSGFASFYEGYLGLWPTVDQWARFYMFRTQSVQNKHHVGPKPMVEAGAASVTPRKGVAFIQIKGLASCRKWLQSYFYVKNASLAVDALNLPLYRPGAPIAQLHWSWHPTDSSVEDQAISARIKSLVEANQLVPDDLVRTFIARRVLPLQRRAHMICQMSGPCDPTRMTTAEMSKSEIRQRVKALCVTSMVDEWEWGMEAYCRERAAPVVSLSLLDML